MEDDAHLRMSEMYRVEAIKAIMDWSINDEIRRSILRKVQDAGADDFRVGEKVAYWREHMVRGRNARVMFSVFSQDMTADSEDAAKTITHGLCLVGDTYKSVVDNYDVQ